MRLVDESAAIREAFPEAYADLVVFVTDLGGTTILMFLLATGYWLTRRRETALVISYAIAGVGLILALKATFGMPRPPEEYFLVASEGDGYGFPSGHAFAATVVYGGLVSAFDRTRDLRAVAGATTLIVLVALSRVVLGVHYLGDVIAGVVLGVAFLLGMNRVTGGDPRRGFAVALALALPALVVVGATEDTLIALGGSIGGLLASSRIDDLPALRSRLEGAVLSVGGVTFVAAVKGLEAVVAGLAPALVALYVVLLAGILLAPEAVDRLAVGPLEATGS